MGEESKNESLGGVTVWIIYADLSQWRGNLLQWATSPDNGVLYVVFEFGNGRRSVSSGASFYGLKIVDHIVYYLCFADYLEQADYYVFNLRKDELVTCKQISLDPRLLNYEIRCGRWVTDTVLSQARDMIYGLHT